MKRATASKLHRESGVRWVEGTRPVPIGFLLGHTRRRDDGVCAVGASGSGVSCSCRNVRTKLTKLTKSRDGAESVCLKVVMGFF